MMDSWREARERRQERRNAFWGGIPMGCWAGGVIVIGIMVFLAALPPVLQWAQSQQWTQTGGQVTRSEVVSTLHSTQSRSQTHYWYTYRPVVEYRYRANGQVYSTQNRIFDIGLLCSSQTNCLIKPRDAENPAGPQKIVSQYPLNRQVVVYYNPNNPSQAVLERRLSGLVFLALGLGLGLCVLGVLMLIFVKPINAKEKSVYVGNTVYDRKKRR